MGIIDPITRTPITARDLERELRCIRADRLKIQLDLARQPREETRAHNLEWDAALARREQELEQQLKAMEKYCA